MKIELILLGIIGVIFLIDFLLKGRKKNTDNTEITVDVKGEKQSFKILNYILNRKKNISLSIIIISALKILTHFYFYRFEGIYTLSKDSKEAYLLTDRDSYLDKKWNLATTKVEPLSTQRPGCLGCKFRDAKEGSIGEADFISHIEDLFFFESWLFIPSALIVLFIAWFFNHKIKAR